MNAPGSREALAARLCELEQAGAGALDPEGARFARRLLDAGLLDRAAWGLDRLALALETARREAEIALAALPGTTPQIDAALGAGRLREAARLARVAAAGRTAEAHAPALSWGRRVAERARAQTPRAGGAVAQALTRLGVALEGSRGRDAAREASALSEALLDDALASGRAAVTLARARAEVSGDSGPYNPRGVAARALDELARVAPGYARALALDLEELAVLAQLPVATKPRALGRRAAGAGRAPAPRK